MIMERLILLLSLAFVQTCFGLDEYTRTVSYEGEILVKWSVFKQYLICGMPFLLDGRATPHSLIFQLLFFILLALACRGTLSRG